MEVVQVLVEVEESQVHRLVATGHRLGQYLLVQAVGFANATAQVDPFDGAFEIALGDIDEKLRGVGRAVVDAVDDAQGIDDEGATLGKQSVDGCSAT